MLSFTVPAGDGQRVEVKPVCQGMHQGRQAPGTIELLDQELAVRHEVGEERDPVAVGLEIVERAA